jgi:lipopolysaccharide biosynthesis regulator YciM
MPFIFAFLLPLALALGWRLAKLRRLLFPFKQQNSYLLGLNYLLSEQPDKALSAFVKAIETDSQAVEPHIALGNLFRKRGEVERAIYIHRSIIARPQLSSSLRMQALLELGRDFLHAGMLDRAEGLFLEIVQLGGDVEQALGHLLEIYQQEKSWHKAIQTAEKIAIRGNTNIRQALGNYYCELAELSLQASDKNLAYKQIHQALKVDKHSARAYLSLANLEMKAGNYPAAVKALTKLKGEAKVYLGETLQPLRYCYRQLANEKQWLAYLYELYEATPSNRIAMTIASYLQEQGQSQQAQDFLLQHVTQHPNLAAICQLLNMYVQQKNDTEQNLKIINALLQSTQRSHADYRCQKCGYAGKTLLWLCPSCRSWNTIQPIEKVLP